MTNTIYVKRFLVNGEFPKRSKEVFVVTTKGEMFVAYTSLKNDWYDEKNNELIPNVEYWLEPKELPSDKEINDTYTSLMESEDTSIFTPRGNFINGAKHTINKITNKK